MYPKQSLIQRPLRLIAGMGIDKANVRTIIHYGAPASLVSERRGFCLYLGFVGVENGVVLQSVSLATFQPKAVFLPFPLPGPSPKPQESYYQQAGRAGRDGVPSECRLYWNAGDLVTMDRIKDAGALSAAGRQAYEKGITTMQVR